MHLYVHVSIMLSGAPTGDISQHVKAVACDDGTVQHSKWTAAPASYNELAYILCRTRYLRTGYYSSASVVVY